jgi:predicted transcriptional regulator
MNAQSSVTVPLDETMAEQLAAAVSASGFSASRIAADALREYLPEYIELLDLIEEGEQSLRDHGSIPHAEVMASIQAMIDAHRDRTKTVNPIDRAA